MITLYKLFMKSFSTTYMLLPFNIVKALIELYNKNTIIQYFSSIILHHFSIILVLYNIYLYIFKYDN
jgi:hypothetical protein